MTFVTPEIVVTGSNKYPTSKMWSSLFVSSGLRNRGYVVRQEFRPTVRLSPPSDEDGTKNSLPSLLNGSLSPSGIQTFRIFKRGFLDRNERCSTPLQVWIPVRVFVMSTTTIRKFSSDHRETLFILFGIWSIKRFLLVPVSVCPSREDPSLLLSFRPKVFH